MSMVNVRLERIGLCEFIARSESGGAMRFDGSDSLKEKIAERVDVASLETLPRVDMLEATPIRPMQSMLASLAGCSAMDLVLILTRQREPLVELTIDIAGKRTDAVPAVYESIHLKIDAPNVDQKKLERAASLAIEKYCSVASMLKDDVRISFEVS